jgi:hypothetical protein
MWHCGMVILFQLVMEHGLSGIYFLLLGTERLYPAKWHLGGRLHSFHEAQYTHQLHAGTYKPLTQAWSLAAGQYYCLKAMQHLIALPRIQIVYAEV